MGQGCCVDIGLVLMTLRRRGSLCTVLSIFGYFCHVHQQMGHLVGFAVQIPDPSRSRGSYQTRSTSQQLKSSSWKVTGPFHTRFCSLLQVRRAIQVLPMPRGQSPDVGWLWDFPISPRQGELKDHKFTEDFQLWMISTKLQLGF